MRENLKQCDKGDWGGGRLLSGDYNNLIYRMLNMSAHFEKY